MNTYDYSNGLWDYVLPCGSSFCHFGGKDISYKILDLLELKKDDRICDICCGEAGTLMLINHPIGEVYGLDISKKALEKASRNLKGRDFNLVKSDVRKMPFKEGYFNKVFAQDPDVFLYPYKQKCMEEIFRITKPEGKFVLQTYCTTLNLKEKDRQETDHILKNIGYNFTDIINLEELERLVRMSGFFVESSYDLYDIYSKDNLNMIKNLEENWHEMLQFDRMQAHNLRKLLYWERKLFSKKAWTGIILVLCK